MSLNNLQLAEMEDVRVLNVARAQGPYGDETARKHANVLLQDAMKCLSSGDIMKAIWLAKRELDFNSRAFGVNHPFTESSTRSLETLQRYARRRREMNKVIDDTLHLKLKKVTSPVAKSMLPAATVQ